MKHDDDGGLFYEPLRLDLEKRKKHSEIYRKNANQRWSKNVENKVNNSNKPMQLHHTKSSENKSKNAMQLHDLDDAIASKSPNITLDLDYSKELDHCLDYNQSSIGVNETNFTTTNVNISENRAQAREENQNVENSQEVTAWHPPSNPFKDSEEFPDEIVHGLNNDQRWFLVCFFEEFYPDLKPLPFILYNAKRGWRGEGGEDVRQNLGKYAYRWCEREKGG